MNNEEPIQTIPENQQQSTTGTPLVESPGISVVTSVPRPLSIMDLIYQWQPMGIRIIVNLPLLGNDQDYICYIRNGPFIPRWEKEYEDMLPDQAGQPPGIEEVTTLRQFAWNNMRNVYTQTFRQGFTSEIHVTQYDFPPIFSNLSLCFRRWRGDIQYRLRTVAGFATQGYIIATPLKNQFSPIGIYDEYNNVIPVRRHDNSFRPEMINSYIMADASMYRHLEITMPYEYPVPYYDQYAWMARRVSPRTFNTETGIDSSKMHHAFLNEPHGDNFICIGHRGTIAGASAGTQLIFELEYRAVEGFQFADPGLPPLDFCEPMASNLRRLDALDHLKTVPSTTLESDGIATIVKLETKAGKRVEVQRQALRRDKEYLKSIAKSTYKPPETLDGATISGNRLKTNKAGKVRKTRDAEFDYE